MFEAVAFLKVFSSKRRNSKYGGEASGRPVILSVVYLALAGMRLGSGSWTWVRRHDTNDFAAPVWGSYYGFVHFGVDRLLLQMP